jgi:hypothetical protein
VIKWRRMRGEEHIARMGEIRNAYKILVGKPEAKNPFLRSQYRWEVTVKLKLSLCLTKHHAMKAYLGVEV